MNIVNTLTMRHMKLNKRRTIVTIIGVALSVCMITAVASFTASFLNLMQRITIEDAGYWHICYSDLTDIETRQITEVLQQKNLASVSMGKDLGYSLLEGSKNKRKPYLFIKAFDSEGFDAFGIQLVEGRLPENGNEAVISDHIAENSGVTYHIGDILTLDIGKRVVTEDQSFDPDQTYSYIEPGEDQKGETFVPEYTKEFVITGIVKRPGFEPYWAPGYTVVTRLDSETMAVGGNTEVFAAFKRVPGNIFGKAEEIAREAGVYPEKASYNTELLRYHLLTMDDRFLQTFYTLAGFVIILIMVGSISLIYNAFAISTAERSRHLGMFASVGATKKQKRNSVFFEGFAIGIIAIPLGLFFGTVGIGVTLILVQPLIGSMISETQKFTLVVSLPAMAAAVFLSMVTIFVSVWVPAKRASKISPIDAIRQTQDIKLTSKSIKTTKITQAVFGFEAELALKNLKRNNKRYKATIISLVLSIVLFLSVSSLSMMTGQSADMATNDELFDIHLMVTSSATEEEIRDFYNAVAKLKGVDQSVIQRDLYTILKADDRLLTQAVKDAAGPASDEDGTFLDVNIISLDDASLNEYAKTIGADTNSLKDTENPKAVLVNAVDIRTTGKYIRSEYINVKKGDSLSVVDYMPDNIELITDFELISITDKTPFGSTVARYPSAIKLYVSEAVMEKILQQYPKGYRNPYRVMLIKSSDPAGLSEAIYEYQKQTEINNINLYDTNASQKESKRLLTFVYVFFYGFIALITAICIANIFNTVSTGIQLRKKEYGMLQSIGMTPKGFYKMINFESIFYGIKALLYGLPLSFLMMGVLYRILGNAFEFRFIIPWGSVLAAVIAVFAIVGATMFYSGSKIRHENIIDMLKDENV